MTIWCNRRFDGEAARLLGEGAARHRLLVSRFASPWDLAPAESDPELASADIAFGQPFAGDCLASERLRWVHVTTAGYTRYDGAEFREALRAKGTVLTCSSAVFADSCAQHVLAMMLGLARQLLPCLRDQLGDRSWHYAERRYTCRVLTGQTVLLLGFGAIARRLVELLAPFRCVLYAVRRSLRSERGVRIVAEEDLTRVLPLAHHVVNVLPDSETTRGWLNARRIGCLRMGARFYNVGRGTTVDPRALAEALQSGRLAEAYLDVTDPEPLPPDHPLWTTPNCYITPHIAGGRPDQDEAIILHFLDNLARFERQEALLDRVI